MANRRAPKPVVSGAMARNLMERHGCAWCGSSSDASTATLEYKVPPRNGEEGNNLDNLVAICSICSQTEVRRIRFPKGVLAAAAEVEGMAFSEIVRVSLAGWLRSRNERTTLEDEDWDVEPDDMWPDEEIMESKPVNMRMTREEMMEGLRRMVGPPSDLVQVTEEGVPATRLQPHSEFSEGELWADTDWEKLPGWMNNDESPKPYKEDVKSPKFDYEMLKKIVTHYNRSIEIYGEMLGEIRGVKGGADLLDEIAKGE